MTDQHQELLKKLVSLRKMVDEATLGPWRYEELKDTWTLYGEARAFKGNIKSGIRPSIQILKAPKHGMSYAEFWPNAVDGALIVTAANMFPFWIDWATEMLNRHIPVPCACNKGTCFPLCGPHRVYQWHECPEVRSVARALGMIHGIS